jgi:hypothetical protein
LASRMRVGHGAKLRVAAILALERRQGGMSGRGRVLLLRVRVTRSSRQAAKGAQARLLLGRVLRRLLLLLLLLLLAGLRLELLALLALLTLLLTLLLALLGGRLLLALFRLELLAI